jgi:YYY domain-containing protein
MTEINLQGEHDGKSPQALDRYSREQWLTLVLLLAIIALGAWLRFTGLDWDNNTHLHPDERFLTLVETAIQLPDSIGNYFDTENSQLNPRNVGYGFFVYGTFPIFLVRYVAEWTGMTGYDQVHILGRAISASFDLVSIVVVYFLGERLFNRKIGLLGALFTTLSVLLIQHSHYFVVDSIANTFILLGLYYAVGIQREGRIRDYAFFGIFLGFAVASKISAFPLAAVAALAAWFYVQSADDDQIVGRFRRALAYLAVAAIISLLIFRIFQPYAFSGPGFFNVNPDSRWLANMSEIREQQRGNTDAPYALQWADRTNGLFSFQNLLLWGLGLPLGITAWLGWGWAAVQMIRGQWQKHALLVIWTGAFFVWQSIGFTQAMRYLIPIYPTLALLAAWGLFEIWEKRTSYAGRQRRLIAISSVVVGGLVVIGTLLWALAFTSIYRQPLTRVSASRWIFQNIPGAINLVVERESDEILEVIPLSHDFQIVAGHTQIQELYTDLTGKITAMRLPYTSAADDSGDMELEITLTSEPNAGDVYGTAKFQDVLDAEQEIELRLEFDRAVEVDPEARIFLNISNMGEHTIRMRSTYLIHETTWDDGLPWGIDGRGLGGRYEVCNLELYWHDDQDDDLDGVADKVQRIVECLSQGEILTISSNRQYGTIPRVPERYPLTKAFYMALLGCDSESTVLACYATAEVGEREGQLGFRLTQVFESHPTLGPIVINDQFAEEAFTVYDHPKVLILEKEPDFDPQIVFDFLSAIEVSHVVHTLPKDVGEAPKDLLLPRVRWEGQQTSGTWSDYFDPDNLINRWPFLTMVIWWLAVGVLGLILFPFTRRALGGLWDQGYALSRIVSLLLFAWIAWMVGSMGIPVRRGTLALVILALMIFSGIVAWRDRTALSKFFKEHWRHVLFIELFAIAFFFLDLGVRMGNPDLWHPAKGGEKPMDFSYLNAVIKSTTFPPYDPWFSSGYINYYYYGFVLVGMPIKLLGIVPSVAYNLVIPTLFALLGLAAYTVGSNLLLAASGGEHKPLLRRARTAGILAAVLVVLAGNLGTARMFYDGFKKIGVEPATEEGTFIIGALQAARGVGRYLSMDKQMPYPMDQWYWNPSRSITPGEGEAGPITEFPFFTFLYADLHAHLISRPLTIFSIAWAVSGLMLASRGGKRKRFDYVSWLFIGALALGALRPTNTWDFPVYWTLAAIAVAYGVWLWRGELNQKTLFEGALIAAFVIAAAQLLYQPFHQWYGLGYEQVDLWQGSRTPIIDFLTVHGVPLFFLTAWMSWETRQWLAETPLSALNKLRPHASVIGALFILWFGVSLVLIISGYSVALLVMPLLLWVVLLLARPQMSLGKRVILSMLGVGIALTFVVEIVVLQGDISRMNTVFKFYLQVWELFNLAAAVACVLVLMELGKWRDGWRWLWTFLAIALVFSALLYPLVASMGKIRDRMTLTAPMTLDGMLYMAFTQRYHELGGVLDLSEDYEAIRWMQDSIHGSPVIVEANVPEYRWGSRFTIYTGLPGVLGWRWHQFQQRVSTASSAVDLRLFDITAFYLTQSAEEAVDFLERYDVGYIVVGGLEETYYAQVEPCYAMTEGSGITCDLSGYPMGMPSTYDIPPESCTPIDTENSSAGMICPTFGLEKFDRMVDAGTVELVYHQDGTKIFEVIH